MRKSFWQRLKEVFVPPPDEDEVKPKKDFFQQIDEIKPEEPKPEKKSFFRKIIDYFNKPKIEIIKETKIPEKPKESPVKQTVSEPSKKKDFVTETEKEVKLPKDEGFKIEFLKDYFKTGAVTVHDLVSEVKNERFGKKYYSPKQINARIKELKKFRQSQIRPIENAILWELDLEKNKKELAKLKDAERSALNQIRRMKGKDFWYAVDTHFKVHRILRSEILKQGDDNSLFLNLIKNDIKDAIKELKKNKTPGYEQRLKILTDKLLPAIEYNIRINSMRDMKFSELDPELLKEIEFANDVTIANNQKEGKYMVMAHVFGESINLFT